MVPLGEYDWPSPPTEETLRRLWKGVVARVRRVPEGPFIAAEDLRTTSSNLLDDLAPPPHCEPFLQELAAELEDWLAAPDAVIRTKLVIVPPCEDASTLEAWAEREGLDRLRPPPRERLLDGDETTANGWTPDLAALQAPADAPVLVVPRLEEWFLRHRNGLDAVRALLAAIDGSERRVVVGCNSWAWTYLAKAVEADMVMANARTFQAFDGPALRRWLHGLVHEPHGHADAVRFRSAQTGDVLFEDEEQDAALFETLAAQSLGIPWVAWHRWRRSLRTTREAEGAEHVESVDRPDMDARAKAPDGRRTVWVSPEAPPDLPDAHERTSLLICHALLLHGGLTARELRTVLPEEGATPILAALVARGFVQRRAPRGAGTNGGGDAVLRCRPGAYPTVRAELSALGFPLDVL